MSRPFESIWHPAWEGGVCILYSCFLYLYCLLGKCPGVTFRARTLGADGYIFYKAPNELQEYYDLIKRCMNEALDKMEEQFASVPEIDATQTNRDKARAQQET